MSGKHEKLDSLLIHSKLSIGAYLVWILAIAVALSQRNEPTSGIQAIINNQVDAYLDLGTDYNTLNEHLQTHLSSNIVPWLEEMSVDSRIIQEIVFILDILNSTGTLNITLSNGMRLSKDPGLALVILGSGTYINLANPVNGGDLAQINSDVNGFNNVAIESIQTIRIISSEEFPFYTSSENGSQVENLVSMRLEYSTAYDKSGNSSIGVKLTLERRDSASTQLFYPLSIIEAASIDELVNMVNALPDNYTNRTLRAIFGTLELTN